MRTQNYLNWFNGEMEELKYEQFLRKFPDTSEEAMLEVAKNGNFDDFRLLCNALYYGGARTSGCFYGDYKTTHRIIAACNERVNVILGEDNAKLYDQLLRAHKAERWGGDERYRLFGYDFAPYDERKTILTIVELRQKYLGKVLNQDDLAAINDLYAHGRYWDLYPERSSVGYDFEHNKRHFAILNGDRKKHMEAWYAFAKYIFNGDYESAYEMLQRYDRLHEKVREENRKRAEELREAEG